MKLILLIFISNLVLASTHNFYPGKVYKGHERINETNTNEQCIVKIQEIVPAMNKMHCYHIKWTYFSKSFEGLYDVTGRVTNRHRPEYPSLVTCATKTDNTTYGHEIYGDDTSLIYNQIFLGDHFVDDESHNYFLTLSQFTKELIRTRVYIVRGSNETTIDCIINE